MSETRQKPGAAGATIGVVELDFERCYRSVASRDPRFDGWWFTAVTTTGIYCRPSCPAMTPRRSNVRFFPTAAAAQRAGFRACKRCRPDATPGSPQWSTHDDVTARAMRLIADGAVDREGVRGLAARLGYSERQLQRHLVASVGAGPLALARAQRAQTARLLAETTDLPLADVAFGAGFSSVRQFNDTVRSVFGVPPSELRRAAARPARPVPGQPLAALTVRLAVREPFAGAALMEYLGARAVDGVEQVAGAGYRRTLRLPRGVGMVSLTVAGDHVSCQLGLSDVRDLGAAVQRCRRLLDLDADPVAVDDHLGADPLLGPAVRACPGRRVAGAMDGDELAIRAVLGQQVSVGRGRDLARSLVERYGPLVAVAGGAPGHDPTGTSEWRLFPSAEAIAGVDLGCLGVPSARRRAVAGLCRALADGHINLDAGADRRETESQLRGVAGVGSWTAGYIVMRALGDPDVFLPTDGAARRAARQCGIGEDPCSLAALSAAWQPWRSYAQQYLWARSAPTPRPGPISTAGEDVRP